MSSKQITICLAILAMSVILAGCVPSGGGTADRSAGIIEVRVAPLSQEEGKEEITAEIMPVLDALFWGSTEERRALVQYVTVGCTTADGLGGPPKCAPGQAEGTLVQVFPVSNGEGHFATPEEIDRTLEFHVESLYAVYRPTPGRDPVEYWPVGTYALLFDSPIFNTSTPVTVFVQEGKMVRLAFSHPVDPAELLGQVPLEDILIPPEEAKALTEELKRPR